MYLLLNRLHIIFALQLLRGRSDFLKSKQSFRFLLTIFFILILVMSTAGCQSRSNSKTSENNASGTITDISQLAHGKIGVWDASISEKKTRELLPDAEYVYYNTIADMAASTSQGKTDAFSVTYGHYASLKTSMPQLKPLPQKVGSYAEHFILRPDERGEQIAADFNAYLAKARESGEIAAINDKWQGTDESLKVIDRSGLTGEKGTIHLAISASEPTLDYLKDGEPVGSEVDIITHFCTEYGYDLQVDTLDYTAMTPAITACKYDIAAAAFEYSEERAQSVRFSDKICDEDLVLVVLDKDSTANTTSFLQSATNSFIKTFIQENRWKMYISGIGQTLLITALSILFGTFLGFGVYLLCRKGGRISNIISRAVMRVIQGTPMVVLLMVFYYIILARVHIAGLWVAILCFTLTFGCAMFGMLESGVKAVNSGQVEGARALGYTDRQAFFKIVLPQATLHFLPTYKSTVVGHIKETAIVGYIAVKDLTKITDIIRGNTFEPFFPLIATAIIYFILSWILTFIIGRLQFAMDPKNRDRSKILTGLKGGDQL